MINFDNITRENIKEHNTNWPQFLDLVIVMILIIGGSGSGKTNVVLNIIKITNQILKKCFCIFFT